MTKGRKRRGDHTGAPEFYLREFLNEEKPTFFWEHDRRADRWSPRGPSQVLKVDNYYDIAAGDNVIDEFMQEIENKAAPFFKTGGFIAARRSPEIVERDRLATFVALMEVRSPQVHQTIQTFMSDLAERTLAISYERFKRDPEAFAQHMADLEQAKGVPTAGMKPEDLDPSKLKIKARREPAVAMVVTQILPVFLMIYKLPWSLLLAQRDEVFITSDKPLLREPFAVPDLNQAEFHHVIPLTRKIALATHFELGGKDRGFVPASTGLVTAINAETWARATRYRFAPRKDFTGHEQVHAWQQRIDFLSKQHALLSTGAQRVVNVVWQAFPQTGDVAAEQVFKDLRLFHGREDVEEVVPYIDGLIANNHRLQPSWAAPLRWWKDTLTAFAKALKHRRRDQEQAGPV